MSGRCVVVAMLASVGLCLAACDTDVWTEHRQLEVSSSNLRPSGTFTSGSIVLERSRPCFRFVGHRVSSDEPPEFERARDESLRACYEDDVRGPAELDEDGCLQLDEPGIVDWLLHRRSCAVEGEFGDDRIRFEVVPLAAVRAIFEYAVPWPTEILGHEIIIEAPQELPAGMIADENEPIHLIEDLARSIGVSVVLGDAPYTVWVTDPWPVGTVIEGDPVLGNEDDDDEPRLSLGFEGRAGDVFDVRVELPAGDLQVGQVRVVSRSDIASLELWPQVVRVAGTDAFLGIGAFAIARDGRGNVLREPPIAWSVVRGDHEIERFGDDAAEPRPWANLSDVCRGARAGEHRSATLEGKIDHFREQVTVEWQCLENHAGCGCTHGAPARRAWLFALGILGLARSRRRARSLER